MPPAACPLLPGEPVTGEPRGWVVEEEEGWSISCWWSISPGEEPRAVPGQGRFLQGAVTPRDAKARSGSRSWGGRW